MKEKSEWHRVVLFGKVAEVAGQYLKKGSKVYIEGKLQTRKWQGQDGQDRYTTEVVVVILTVACRCSIAVAGSGGFAPAQQAAPAKQQSAQPAPAMVDDGFDDDIPF